MTIFVNMGAPQSKNSEVIIAQSGAGNHAQAEVERQLQFYSIVTIVVVIIIITTCLFILCRAYGRKLKSKFIDRVVATIEEGRGAQTAVRPNTQPVTVQY